METEWSEKWASTHNCESNPPESNAHGFSSEDWVTVWFFCLKTKVTVSPGAAVYLKHTRMIQGAKLAQTIRMQRTRKKMITYYGLWVKPQYAGPADYNVEVCTSSDWNSGEGSKSDG